MKRTESDMVHMKMFKPRKLLSNGSYLHLFVTPVLKEDTQIKAAYFEACEDELDKSVEGKSFILRVHAVKN